MSLFYLDEVGFSLSLGVTYTWSKRGSKNRLHTPLSWSSRGRLNLIGALAWKTRTLHFETFEESIKSKQAVAFIDAIAQGADPDKLTVIVLDNARFHTSIKIKEKQPEWEKKGVLLRFLPPYCPHLNPIEALWKQLKSFLLPRRHYDSLSSLKQAVFAALDLLGAIRVRSKVGSA